ncbi:hypothetical protein G7054_g3539 [Neopestalotiopsis clavispora]|nr:hypothetical protein G7054_g3539 [Neopestalotiopsis clavispora]
MVRSTNENLEEVPDGGESVGLNEAIAGPSYPMHPIPNGGHPIAGSSNGPAIRSRRAVHIRTPENRLTYRKLRPIHLFMITINGTLGTGLYWRGGQALELGGPLALILAFLLVGFLAWAVMQCISEMLCIWPVPSALSVFVRKFVDEELGIAVGIAYWFTYSAGFAALIAAAAAEMKYWQNLNYPQSVFLYLLLPILLVIINSFGIELYGWIEVTTGIIKSTFLFIILVATIALVKRSGNAEAYWNNSVEYDTSAATNWFSAFCLCLSTAIFTYIGVEIPAASALEARGQGDERSTSPERTDGNGSDLNAAPRTQTRAESIGATIIYSAKRTSMIAFIVYFISAILISVAIDRGNCSLPRPGWLASSSECQEHSQNGPNSTSSVFVIVAAEGGEAGLADAFNGFLIFTAITCANTNLYVASRTLFGLANQVDGGRNQGFWANIVASFGRTNKYRVPVRAMSLSAFAFSWVPFLNLASVDAQTYASDAINTFVNILSQMTSVSALIVWACECWAFIRFFHQ